MNILITDNEFFASKVSEQLENEIEKLKRVKIAKKSWFNFGAIIVVKKINNSIHLINDIAPEHLELTIANAEKFIKKINNAGAIFIGKYTPEAIGDYIAGPNHVLPTDRTAKFSSGLNVLDFVKRTSLASSSDNSPVSLFKIAVYSADLIILSLLSDMFIISVF